jgi:hypothetical protein
MTATATGFEFAEQLDDLLDVPLVVCKPKPDEDEEEFFYPAGERNDLKVEDNHERLAKWQPGWAIMGRMGGNVAAVDVDPRNGGDIDKTRQLLDGLNVRIFGEVGTPNGRHFYIAGHPELASCSKLDGWPGIDVLSFGRLVFLPGTRRPKYGGAGYQVIFEDLEALADGGDLDGAEAFADWVAERRGDREQFETSSPWQGGEPDARQAAYLQKMLAGVFSDLIGMGKDSGRNTAVYNKAMKCGNFIAGAGLKETAAVKILFEASRLNGLVREDGERSVYASIASGIKNGKTRPRAVPEPRDNPNDPFGSPATNGSTAPPPPPAQGLTLPSSFYDERPELTLIREWAHGRDASADAVLYATLARNSAMVPHGVRIDTGVLTPAPANLFVAACGGPGAGKSSSASVAKGLYLSALEKFRDGLPLGSGEGIVESFFAYVWVDDESRKPKADGTPYQVRVKRQEYHNAFLVADEGQAMCKMMEKSGSVLGETIRTLWSGGTTGQNNASAETSRILREGRYSIGLFVGFQPDTIQPLLADDAGGTPQRFVYCWVVDEHIPDDAEPMEELGQVFYTGAEMLVLAPAIKAEIKALRKARQRGQQVDRLDVHDYLTKVKLAAGLCLLGGRTVIDEDDWRLAGIMWQTSCRVRDEMVSYGKSLHARAAHEKNVARALGEGMAETARQEAREKHDAPWRVARNIANKVHGDGSLRTVGAVSRKLAARDQRDHDLMASAWGIAIDESWVIVSGDAVEPGGSKPA